MSNKLKLNEIVFIAIMASALGIAWWAYSFVYNLVSPFLKVFALSGLIEGFWQMSGVFFALIIRKRGSALLGAMIAAGVEGLISQWGISALVSGFCQGLPVELAFLAFGYRKFNLSICMLAGALSALGGYLVTYFWYGYNEFSLLFNILNLSSGMVSGALLGGVLSRYLALKLKDAGVLNQFAIACES